MPPLPLNSHARRLAHQLELADATPTTGGQNYHVAGLGSGFYFAYEQLRNVAEYREHHLLLRGAIQRYLVRTLRFEHYEPVAGELVTELTQAGYIKNDSIPITALDQADEAIQGYCRVFADITAKRTVPASRVALWLYQMVSVHIETLLAPDPRGTVTMHFTFEHYFYAVDRSAVADATTNDHIYRVALFCATQRAIFKSDIATTRYYCVSLSLPDLPNQPIEHIIELCNLIDELYQSPLSNKLFRLINRYGAPMRILREFIIEGAGLGQALDNRAETLSRIKTICTQEYQRVQKGLSSRIIKTILFILITKTLIGVAIEVPYDLFESGVISVLPLVVNIAFPVIYMIALGTRIHMPSRQNTDVIAGYIDRILYDGAGATMVYKPKRRVTSAGLNSMFSFVYFIAFVGSLALLVYCLTQLGFNAVNGFIFFLFFSAVSFLGIRLRQSAHELSMLDERQGLLQTLVDFLSTPFVRVGHWLSDKYAKANIVTTLLDIAIEMPIKTSLRLVRQWVGFMRDKQEEL